MLIVTPFRLFTSGFNMIAEQLINLHEKRTTTGEIIVTLFEFCDLSCLFCNQDHDSILGMDNIVDRFEQVKLCIDKLLSKGKTEFHIHIMGGEVFSDKLNDKVFLDYEELTYKIKNYCKDKNIPVNISFITNFIWTKKERVRTFLNKVDVDVMTSYDPAGRFNQQNFEIFKENIQEFKNYITTVNVVMTKPTIDKFTKNQVPFFDYLYANFLVFFDYYGPEKNQNLLLPKDVDVRDFMIFMSDNWPNVAPVKDFFSKTKKTMTCMDTYTVMPTGKWGGCGYFEQLEKVIPIKVVTEQQWFDNYNCVECEHFQRCSLGCFMSNHIKDMRTQKQCWLKQVYDYIDSK
jgi:hypothetical protein